MKNTLIIFIASITICSCQIEDEFTPSPEDAYIKYYGELTSYRATDIEIQEEAGEPTHLLVLGSKLTQHGDDDLFLLRTDLFGNIVDSVSFGFNTIIDADRDGVPDFDIDQNGTFDENDVFRGNDTPGKLLVTNEFIFVVGTTSITANLNNRTISDWKQLILAIIPRSANLGELNNESLSLLAFASERNINNPNSTVLDLIGNDIVSLQGGGLLLVGSQEIDRGGGITDFDSFLIKIQLGLNSPILFERTLGVELDGEDESIIRAFEKDNGNIVLIGHGYSSSRLGENDGNNGRNVFFTEVDPNGTPITSRYYGVDHIDEANTAIFNEEVKDAIDVGNGYIIAGTSSTSQSESFGFAMNLNENGDFIAGGSLPSGSFLDGNTALQTAINGVTETIDNELILVGRYPGFSTASAAKSGEALFMKVDQSIDQVEGHEANFGLTDGDDEFADAVTLPDGSIVVAGSMDFGAGTKLFTIIKLNDTGSLIN